MPKGPMSPVSAPPGNRGGWIVPALLVAAVALGLFYRYGVRDHVFAKNFGVVDAGKVYRSGQLTPAVFRRVVEEHGIRTIIDLGSALRPDGKSDDAAVERRNREVAAALGVTRYRFDLIGDATGNPNEYVQALEIMTDPAAHPVLVHCGAGSERTGAAIAIYRHVTGGVPLEAAYEEARSFKHDPRRNPKLKAYLDRYAEEIVRALRLGAQVPGEAPVPAPEPAPEGAAR